MIFERYLIESFSLTKVSCQKLINIYIGVIITTLL